MNREELTKTSMMISNWNKFSLRDLYKINSALWGLSCLLQSGLPVRPDWENWKRYASKSVYFVVLAGTEKGFWSGGWAGGSATPGAERRIQRGESRHWLVLQRTMDSWVGERIRTNLKITSFYPRRIAKSHNTAHLQEILFIIIGNEPTLMQSLTSARH